VTTSTVSQCLNLDMILSTCYTTIIVEIVTTLADDDERQNHRLQPSATRERALANERARSRHCYLFQPSAPGERSAANVLK
jgi:hypothetical protein